MRIKVKEVVSKLTKNGKNIYFVEDMNERVYSTFDEKITGTEGKFIEVTIEEKKVGDKKYYNITEWSEVKEEKTSGNGKYGKQIEDYRSINLSYALKYAELTGKQGATVAQLIEWAEEFTQYVVNGMEPEEETIQEPF